MIFFRFFISKARTRDRLRKRFWVEAENLQDAITYVEKKYPGWDINCFWPK